MLSLNSFISLLGMLAGSGSIVFIESLLGYYVFGVCLLVVAECQNIEQAYLFVVGTWQCCLH